MINLEIIHQTLALGVEYVVGAQVEGDLAEFGVMNGGTASTIAHAMKLHNAKRKLHLFDSFKGLPEIISTVDAESVHVKSGVWSTGGCAGGNADSIRALITAFLPESDVVIHAGWFRDTLVKLGQTKLSMIHIDCDLYQSTIEILEYVFKHNIISDGCLILFDDWNCNRASTFFGERQAWGEINNRYPIRFSDEGGYGWAGHKFIVHHL